MNKHYAIKVLKDLRIFDDDCEEDCKALDMAVEALENRIPKKPMHSGGSVFYICPNCNKLIRKNERAHGKIDIPHCKWCGQALDWSE